MNIQKLELPKVERRWREQRCARLTQSTGTHHFEDKRNQCARMARFKLDGIPFCTQHAGEMALKYLINETPRYS